MNLTETDRPEISVYSEAAVRRALFPSFRVERLEGMLVALPPPYLARAWDRIPAIHTPAMWLEDLLRSRWPFRGWGEHIHLWARRGIR
jgi:hypothetical protein